MIADFCAAETLSARIALAERQLATLAAREDTVRAFACFDASAARKRLAKPGDGPLSGALVAAKDIIATADFPTRYGTKDADDLGPSEDAWCIERLKQLDGVLLGKAVCTAFAYPRPGPTTNPHDAMHTPGGSSSGSAAAVAAGFVSFAFGSQTAGSTIRPASYCGVTGFKPSYGLLPIDGVQAISSTLDHLGLFAVSPRDVWYLASAMIMPCAEVLVARKPRRVLLLRLPLGIPQEDGYREHLADLAGSLRAEGVSVELIDLPFPLDDFRNLQGALCYWEAARILSASPRVRMVPELEALLGPYHSRDASAYAVARRKRQTYQAQFDQLVADVDAVLLPAATGAAPPVSTTGDAVMSRFWTALHMPAISVPMWRTSGGLPLGLQLLGRLGSDRALVEVAQWFIELSSYR